MGCELMSAPPLSASTTARAAPRSGGRAARAINLSWLIRWISPVAILLQFLVESVMLCLLGGLIGVLNGQALVSFVASFPDAKLDKSYIPFWAILLAFGFSATVGLVFGMFPAVKASRLDPIEALRHE